MPNKIIITVLLILLVAAIGLLYLNYRKPTVASSSLKESGLQAQNILTLEEIYAQSNQLPLHNTVCFPMKQLVCTGVSCEPENPTVFNLIGNSRGIEEPTLSRCDSNGCNVHSAAISPSGDYVNIQLAEPSGYLLKMSLSELRFIEIATIGLGVQISQGQCRYVN